MWELDNHWAAELGEPSNGHCGDSSVQVLGKPIDGQPQPGLHAQSHRSVLVRTRDAGSWKIPVLQSNINFQSKEQETRRLQRVGLSNCQKKTLHLSVISVAVFGPALNVKSYIQCNRYFEWFFCRLMDLIVRKWFLIFSQNQAFQKQVLFAHFPPLIFMANVDISFMGFFFKASNW